MTKRVEGGAEVGLFDGMNISASGLTAERTRLDVIANNVANANSTRTAAGGPYRREYVTLSPKPIGGSFASQFQSFLGGQATGEGVQVSAIGQDNATPFNRVYDPTNADAVHNPASPDYGYVLMPNVDVSTEMVDMISASRAYEANVTVLDTSKSMYVKALQIGT